MVIRHNTLDRRGLAGAVHKYESGPHEKPHETETERKTNRREKKKTGGSVFFAPKLRPNINTSKFQSYFLGFLRQNEAHMEI